MPDASGGADLSEPAWSLSRSSPFHDVLTSLTRRENPVATETPTRRIEAATAAVARGGMILCTGCGPVGTAHLIIAAQHASASNVSFMASLSSAPVSVALPAATCAELQLNTSDGSAADSQRASIPASVDARSTTRGRSLTERLRTIDTLASPTTSARDLRQPGHVFVLAAAKRGVLARTQAADAAVDLVRIAGLTPAAVLCEIVLDDVATGTDASDVAHRYGLATVSVDDVVVHRRLREGTVHLGAGTSLPTPFGRFDTELFVSDDSRIEVLAVHVGRLGASEVPPLVRIHSECLAGDAFRSLRCDCREQLQAALETIAAEGRGAVLYLRGHESGGAGLIQKLRYHSAQDAGDGLGATGTGGSAGIDVVDRATYDVAAETLLALGVRSVRLMTNNAAKVTALERMGVIVERVDCPPLPSAHDTR